jgi:hypothetical protein
MCGSPAYAEQHFDPAKGVYEESFFTPVAKARASDGLCGPEAQLYEPKSPAGLAALRFTRGLHTVWMVITAGVFLVALLSLLLSI